jgi:hypothetical protein
MAIGLLLIILGLIFLFLLSFPIHVLLGVICIVLGVIDLFWVGRTLGGTGPRRYWY